MRRIGLLSLFVISAVLSLRSASLPTAKPEDVGLSTERLQRIHTLVQRHMDLGDITGAVMLVARKGQVAFVEAQGTMDLETKQPMTRDTVFRLASMTKPVIGTAVMMMLEEGKVQLGDPISKYIPEFKNMKVAVAQGAAPGHYNVPAAHDITVKELLTHTSGFSSGPMGQSEIKERRKPAERLQDYLPRLAAAPLEFQPGTQWMYSASDGFDVLARVVEVASNMPLDKFLKQRIFDPLDMPNTSHYPTDAQMPKLVTAYTKNEKGLAKNQNSLSMSSKVYFAGGGGLVTTIDDYSHFAQMLANGGELNGKRLLSPRTVKLMSSVHVPSTLPGRTTGEGFGLSVRVMQDAIAGNHRVSDGSFGWSGAYGTHFWVDPKEDIVAIMMIQTPIREMRPEFENAVMQAIVK